MPGKVSSIGSTHMTSPPDIRGWFENIEARLETDEQRRALTESDAHELVEQILSLYTRVSRFLIPLGFMAANALGSHTYFPDDPSGPASSAGAP
jgi:hypothetical protein